VDALREAAATVTVSDPVLPLLSNQDGAAVRTGADWLERIVTQVSAPVRWNLVMRTMTELEAGALIELPPAGTLTGLARRAMPGVALAALKTPDDIAAATARSTPTTTAGRPRSGACWSRRWPARSATGRSARLPRWGRRCPRARRSGTSSSAADGT
jgi:acyl transferase domain-containing protein